MCARDSATFRVAPILLTLTSMLFGIISILGVAVRWAVTDFDFPGIDSPENDTASFGLMDARILVLFSYEANTFVFTWDDSYETYKTSFDAFDSCIGAACDNLQNLFSKGESVGKATFAFMLIGLILSFVGLVTMILRRYTAIASKHLRRMSYAFLFASAIASIIGLLVWDQEFVAKSHFGVQHGVGVGLAGFSVTLVFVAAFMQVLWQKGGELRYKRDNDGLVLDKSSENTNGVDGTWG